MTRSPDEEEDIAYELNQELGRQEQREINRRVQKAGTMSYLRTPSAIRQALRTAYDTTLFIPSHETYRTLSDRAYRIMREFESLPNVIDDETFTACLAQVDALNSDIRRALKGARRAQGLGS